VVRSRELIVPVGKIADAGEPIRLALPASDLETLPLFRAEHLRPMPDHWEMPAGFDERDLFLVGGGGWTEGGLPFMETSPTVSGTPAYVQDKDSIEDPAEPDIAVGMPVYDSMGRRVGNVESIAIDQASDKITWIRVRGGFLFARESTVPASLIKSVTDRVTLNASSEAVKRLEPA
jgi:sporulation protein YlmC with PRC-barrel domain